MLRFGVILTVFLKELRELSRDRRSLMVMFGVPLIVYPLMFAGIGGLAQKKAEQQRTQTAKVAVVGLDGAPELARRLEDVDARVSLQKHEDASEIAGDALASGAVDVVLLVPPDAERRLLTGDLVGRGVAGPKATTESAGKPTTGPVAVADEEKAPDPEREFVLRVNRSRGDSDAAEGRLRGILAEYQRWVIGQRLAERDVPAAVLSPLPSATVDVATKDQRLGRFLAQLLPLLLLVTGMLGAFFPALSATTTERELGTLETLLVSPVHRDELLLAKGGLVLLCSMLTAGLNIASMSFVFVNLAAQSRDAFGAVAVNPGALGLAFVSAIPSLVLFSAMVMCVGLVARTYREASSFAAPVMMMPLAAMAVGMADPPTTKALLATPVANTTILIRDILTARFTWGNFLLAAGVNLGFAVAVLSVAARLFTNEQLVNPAWEPLSLKGWRKKGAAKGPRRVPTVDEALVLVGAAILIQFYAGPWLGTAFAAGKIDAISLVIVLLMGSFLVPAVLMGIVGRYDVARVWPLRASAAAVGVGVLLGLGLMPLAMAWGQLQAMLVESGPSDAAKSVARLIDASFDINPWLAAVVFGVVPGICEEVVFRGVVLSALGKRLNRHAAVWATGLLFAAIHLDLAGFVPRAVLGAMLGYVTLASGSVLPAMVLHATFNASQVGLIAFYNPTAVATTQPGTEAIPEALRLTSLASVLRIAAGVACVAMAAALWGRMRRRATA